MAPKPRASVGRASVGHSEEDRKKQQLQKKFQELDDNGDGFLSFDELHDLLLKGNGKFTESEVRTLYNNCDANHDGKISFQEFVDYIYKQEHPGKERTSAARHAHAALASAPHDDGTETDWTPIEDIFTAFAGKDMDGREFAKFCKDCHLIGGGFANPDIDLTFSKVAASRRMDFAKLQDAIRLIAQKKKVPTCDVMEAITSSGATGPRMRATKTDAVRFYDDKSTFTGAHAHNEKFDGADPSKALGRHERRVDAAYKESHGREEGDWSECERVFEAFSEHHHFESKNFKKMCLETERLIGDGFMKADIDVIFTAAKGGSRDRSLNFEQFKEAVRKIAAKKHMSPAAVQDIIAASEGPVKHATEAEYSRFYDDKSTFTGAHAHNEKFDGADPSKGLGRHDKIVAHTEGPYDDGTETDWAPIEAIFTAFAGKDMDGREFAKFCKDSHLMGGGFANPDIDLTFAKFVAKGSRRMNFANLQDAIRLIAHKKKMNTGDVMEVIASSGGPVMNATKTDAVRFYDDKSTFTGAHAQNEKFDGVDHTKALGRHERMAEHAYKESHGREEGDWSECERVFEAFSEHHHFESKHFKKMCLETDRLIGGGFMKGDIDVIFTGAKGASKDRSLNFEQFKEAVRKIAAKKHMSPAEVQSIIAASEGPVKHATEAEYSRFHDDKSTYTGHHAMVHGRGEHGDGRHAALAEDARKLAEGDEDEHPWDGCEEVFRKYIEHGNGLASRDWNKLIGDIKIFDTKFTKHDVDTTYVHAVGRGGRSMNFAQFHVAIREVAKKKRCPVHVVQAAVENCEGPHVHATTAEYSRFHDDKDTYTGMHHGK